MRVLVLRFDAPLISFGGARVDQHGVVQAFPGLSMLVGLIANALGWHHRDSDRLTALQDRLRFAARIDRRGEPLIDYQTVDLGTEWMLPELAGWTSRGRIAEREGAKDTNTGTHQRWRHYRADSVHTVALTIDGDGAPSIDQIAAALREPARPLFLGRKCCLPAGPLVTGEIADHSSLVAALAAVPRHHRADKGTLPATWFDNDPADGSVGESRVVPVSDERDWANQVHVGRRFMREGHVDPAGSMEAVRD